MLRGLYTAAAGMITQQRKHDTITNNIANVNTPGFKTKAAVSRAFPDVLVSLMNGDKEQPAKSIGRLNTGVMVEEILPIFRQGDLTETTHPTDFALRSDIRVFEEVEGEQVELQFDASGKAVNAEGETVYQPQAFFTVQNDNGEQRYTRNGKFYINENGFMLTNTGYSVLDTNGQPIVLNVDMDNVRVTPTGQLVDRVTEAPVIDGLGNPISLMVTRVDNPFELVREGNGVYRADDPEAAGTAPIVDAEEVAVLQGFIERSNVDPAKSMTDMMIASRAYEANQKIVQYYDQTLEKAVNQIGRV